MLFWIRLETLSSRSHFLRLLSCRHPHQQMSQLQHPLPPQHHLSPPAPTQTPPFAQLRMPPTTAIITKHAIKMVAPLLLATLDSLLPLPQPLEKPSLSLPQVQSSLHITDAHPHHRCTHANGSMGCVPFCAVCAVNGD